MELRSISELQKIRKKLVKELAAPKPLRGKDWNAIDDEIWEGGVELTKRAIQDIDAEIRERTGTNSD